MRTWFRGSYTKLKLRGDDSVASSITSLGRSRNVSCIVLFYKYYFGKCSFGLSEWTSPPQVFASNTRVSGRSHAYTVASMTHRITHYRKNSFFTRTARLWHDLHSNIFKASVNKRFLLSPSSIKSIILHYIFFFKQMQCSTLIGISPAPWLCYLIFWKNT